MFTCLLLNIFLLLLSLICWITESHWNHIPNVDILIFLLLFLFLFCLFKFDQIYSNKSHTIALIFFLNSSFLSSKHTSLSLFLSRSLCLLFMYSFYHCGAIIIFSSILLKKFVYIISDDPDRSCFAYFIWFY